MYKLYDKFNKMSNNLMSSSNKCNSRKKIFNPVMHKNQMKLKLLKWKFLITAKITEDKKSIQLMTWERITIMHSLGQSGWLCHIAEELYLGRFSSGVEPPSFLLIYGRVTIWEKTTSLKFIGNSIEIHMPLLH